MIRVYLTVDVECAEERVMRGVPLPAQGYDLRVWGRFANQSRELGIGLIMDELEAEGLRGTFYVEPFGAYSFGFDGLTRVVSSIVTRGHDVQLHAHPIQRVADYRSRGVRAIADDMAAYGPETQAELLREGLAILQRCGAPRISSFRAGNFGANADTWDAMAKVGLTVSSNYNPCYFERNCRMRSPFARTTIWDTQHGVWELPIGNFACARGRPRHLQLAAVSLAEMKHHLTEAHRRGEGDIVFVTHSFELCHIDEPARHLGRPSTVTIARLRGLCRFLSRNANAFQVEAVGALAARLGHKAPSSKHGKLGVAGSSALLRDPPALEAERMLEQAWKRLEARARIRFAPFAR